MIFSLILVAMLVASPTGEQHPPTREECQEHLNGKWLADLSPKQSVIMEIRNEQVKFYGVLNGKLSLAWTGKMTLSQTLPSHHLDWKGRQSTKGPLPDNQCLYRLADETLLLIGGGPDKRPSKFLSGRGGEPKTIVFTRVVDDSLPK